MPTARYVFVRATAAKGIAPARIGTSAIGALSQWSRLTDGRVYKVESQDDAKVVAALNWDAGDPAAAEDLSLYCKAYGVDRLFKSR
jgi:hypothetical protein